MPDWVKQEDEQGCGLAVLAMLCGHTYQQVKDIVDSWEVIAGRDPTDWNTGGTTHYTLDRYLANEGWFIQRHYDAWPELTKEPFAEVHYASVEQPSRRYHFVVVLEDGAVLDPHREGLYRLSDWTKTNQLVGLTRPSNPAA